MSLIEIMAEFPALSVADRQFLIRQAMDLDDPSLSAEDETEVERRLEGHRYDPESTIPLDTMKARLLLESQLDIRKLLGKIRWEDNLDKLRALRKLGCFRRIQASGWIFWLQNNV